MYNFLPPNLSKTFIMLSLFLLISFTNLKAQQAEIVSVRQLISGEFIVKISQTSANADGSPPKVTLYEVIKAGDNTKSVLRKPIVLNLEKTPENYYEITIMPPTASENFVRFEADIANYLSDDENLIYRVNLIPGATAEFLSANENKVTVKFTIPYFAGGNCRNAKNWIIKAFEPTAGTTFKVTRPNNSTETYNVIGADVKKVIGGIVIDGIQVDCTVQADLKLNDKLPVNESLKPATVVFSESFINSPLTLNDYPYFASLRDGIKGSVQTEAGLNRAEERDKERKTVLEIGGGLTTVKKREDVTDPDNDRETTGFLDLRIALPTKYYINAKQNESGNVTSLSGWTWTPLQFDAMISEGSLLKNNLSTNTMRLFTQAEYIKSNSPFRDWIGVIIEGGVAADRDLRVLDYTGGVDFRWEPGFLNRTFGTSESGNTPTVRFSILPAGVEIGARQVRRDPFFPDTDAFIRRFRFSEKFELQLPPYAEFVFDHRAWIRGEAPSNKFRNYFKTTLNIFPGSLNDNFSGGLFLSFERGTLPPFSTPSTSTFKIGFRIRRKEWNNN